MLSGDTSTWLSGEQEGIYPATVITRARAGGTVEGPGLRVATPHPQPLLQGEPAVRSSRCNYDLIWAVN